MTGNPRRMTGNPQRMTAQGTRSRPGPGRLSFGGPWSSGGRGKVIGGVIRMGSEKCQLSGSGGLEECDHQAYSPSHNRLGRVPAFTMKAQKPELLHMEVNCKYSGIPLWLLSM